MADNYGGSAVRYDWNLVVDPIARDFLSPRNSAYLQKEIKKRGYVVRNMQSLLPRMYEVLSTTINSGYDPSVCDRKKAFPISKLNAQFLRDVISEFEVNKCAFASYETYLRNPLEPPLNQPMSDSAKHQELMYNNRWW